MKVIQIEQRRFNELFEECIARARSWARMINPDQAAAEVEQAVLILKREIEDAK